jgi:hypothetical protein
MIQIDKEASQTREYCIAKNAMHRTARLDPSAGKRRPPQDDKHKGGVPANRTRTFGPGRVAETLLD